MRLRGFYGGRNVTGGFMASPLNHLLLLVFPGFVAFVHLYFLRTHRLRTFQFLSVSNRWGDIVWATDDPEQPCLGESAGGTHYAPNGLYLWKVTYRDQLGYPVVRQGTVSLVR